MVQRPYQEQRFQYNTLLGEPAQAAEKKFLQLEESNLVMTQKSNIFLTPKLSITQVWVTDIKP